MVEKIKKPDFLLRVLSVFLAVLMWLYVSYAENPEMEIWFHGVTMTYINSEGLRDKNLIHVSSSSPETISLKVRGSRKALLSLSAHDISATVDLSGIYAPSQYSLPVTVGFPIDGLSVVDKKPYNVTVSIETIVKKDFKVDPVINGTPTDGYVVSSYSSSVETVTVASSQKIIDSISHAEACIDIDGAFSKKSTPAEIKIIMNDGSELKNETAYLSNTYSTISVDVNPAADAAVEPVVVVPEGFKAEVTADPNVVKVAAPQSTLQKSSTVKTLPVYPDAREGAQTITAVLNLPDDVQTADGRDSVTLQINLTAEGDSNG